MNYISHAEVFYLRPSRTIELLVVSKGNENRVCFVYNFEGNHFRFFENLESLASFFRDRIEPKLDFDNESSLDKFILQEF